jgi:hypothetical protein
MKEQAAGTVNCRFVDLARGDAITGATAVSDRGQVDPRGSCLCKLSASGRNAATATWCWTTVEVPTPVSDGQHDPPSENTSEAWIDETWAQWNRIARPMSITIAAYSTPSWVEERARRMAWCEWFGIGRFSSL